MQVVAVRLCFVDDAICCVYVETKSRLALNLTIQRCSNFSSLKKTPSHRGNDLKIVEICSETRQTALECSQELTSNNRRRPLMQIIKYQHDKDHTSYTLFHQMQTKQQ